MSEFLPMWVSPPGDTILDILKEKNISVWEFAEQMNFDKEFAVDFLKGEKLLDKKIASKLEKVLGSSKKFWLKREEQYREDLIRLNK